MTTAPDDSLTTRLYEFLIPDEEDARVCRDIPDEACTDVPANFLRTVAAQALTKLGDAVMSPKTTLAWLTGSLGAPVWVAGALVPIRESGSMLPQLAIAGYIRTMAHRKWIWVIGAILQGLAVAAMGVVAVTLGGVAAGWALLGCTILFSLARGLSSIAAKDVLGKTVPKTRRGRVTGYAGAVAGAGTMAVAAFLMVRGNPSDTTYLVMLLIAAGLWFIGAGVFATVDEPAGATEGGREGFIAGLKRLSLLRTDADFRRFIVARTLLLATALSAPYYVLLAQESSGASLGAFLLAQGTASMVSGPIWATAADRSSRRVLLVAGIAAGVLGVLVFAVHQWIPTVADTVWFYPLAFLALAVIHDGVRLGRKTYVVDLAESGTERTDYVAVGNSVIGLILLATGLVGVLAQAVSTGGVILVLAISGLASAVVGRRLPEVQGR